ncbi:MAG: sugar ABC transporter ATP-binding protein [Spirochaetaceae bacterium]|jgi:ribose transport system ATP-binding protein|nr:sugar ABC transporter ATP-binding protein [Spirochaetaceae bacterium]
MCILDARNITKEFFGVRALDSVSLRIEAGRIHCIIGENGAGKSTLIKILKGIYLPDSGSISINGQDVYRDGNKKLHDCIAYVPQELNLFREMTVAENLFIPFDKTGIQRRLVNKQYIQQMAAPWLERFQISADAGTPVKNISVSEQQLLQIARAMVDETAQALILDEPTTSLTNTEVERLFDVIRQLKEAGKAVVFISHKLEEIFSIGDEITILRNGVKVAHAPVGDVDIPWVISEMVGREINQSENYRSEKVSEEVLLEVKGLSGERFSNIDFTLHKGEILGFSGLIGSGRTEIMQALFGYIPVWSGTAALEGNPLKFGSTVVSARNGFIYLPEERKQQGILPLLGTMSNISMPLLRQFSPGGVVQGRKEQHLAREVIKTYNIKVSSLSQPVQYLSGGNQQKVIIGRSMSAQPKILVFDEPTKGIDIGSKVEIYRLMKKFAEENQMGIILISSEMNEVLKCANKVIAVYFGKKSGEFSAPVDKTKLLNAVMGIQKAA